MPEQVTINIGENAVVPTPPPGHKWEKVIHDSNVAWLATWKENVNDNIKYVLLGATSSLKGQSDLKKFEKARSLKVCKMFLVVMNWLCLRVVVLGGFFRNIYIVFVKTIWKSSRTSSC
jgi:hypothetical protein